MMGCVVGIGKREKERERGNRVATVCPVANLQPATHVTKLKDIFLQCFQHSFRDDPGSGIMCLKVLLAVVGTRKPVHESFKSLAPSERLDGPKLVCNGTVVRKRHSVVQGRPQSRLWYLISFL